MNIVIKNYAIVIGRKSFQHVLPAMDYITCVGSKSVTITIEEENFVSGALLGGLTCELSHKGINWVIRNERIV